MSDDSRSPRVCPWDPGEACKVGIGACLPPRKRLLAGLKQSGWLSSSSSYVQSCNRASCAGLMEELKLEVDLAEANLESNGDTCLVESTVCKQVECNAAESSVSLKSKKASRRRKSLSVLADCHGSVNKLQPEALPGGKIEKKLRTYKASIPNGKKESSRETVDAARAAAARAAAAVAAKAAAEARAIALDKAQAAAEAAAVAKAALEALAHVAYDDEEWGFLSSKHVRKHRRKGNKMNKELSPLLHPEGTNSLSEKREEERVRVCSAPLHNGMEVVQTQISHVALSPVGVVAGRDKIKEDKRTDSHQFLIVDLASAPSDKIKEDEPAHLDHFYTAACPPPPPLDDEKFARQLHRVMNSSPRISRNRAPLESSKKLEMAPFSTQGCTQNKYPQAGGCNLSREKKPVYKEKTRVLRTSFGRADVKVKSMSAINETLNMLQGASSSQVCVLDDMVSCAASDANNIYVKEDLCMPTISTHAFASSTESNEEGDKLIVNGGIASSCKLDVEARRKKDSFSSYSNEPDAVGADAELRAVKWAETIKKQKLRTGGTLLAASPGKFQLSSQRRDSNGNCAMPAINTKNHPGTFCNAASEASGSHFETLRDYDEIAVDENNGRVNVSGSGPTPQMAGDSVEEMSPVRNSQENSFRDKSSRATRKSSPVSSHGERHTRRQKVLVVLANSISKGNQNFGGNLNVPSYMPSPTVS